MKSASSHRLTNNQSLFLKEVLDILSKLEKRDKRAMEKLAASFSIFDKTEVKELIELGIVMSARKIAHNESLTRKQQFERIVSLYQNQVNLSHRTSQSILLQQYSTPAPIGYLAGEYCGIDQFNEHNQKLLFEPSAGNGLLTISAKPENCMVNEIDNLRNKHLQVQSYKAVYKVDATKDFAHTIDLSFYKKFDAVITNPPFGYAGKGFEINGYPIATLEHLMAVRALETMKDNGKAAIIIGGHTKYDDKGRIEKGAQRIFFNYLYAHYNVDDVIPINGSKLYSRQGTSFDTRLILINGRKLSVNGVAPVYDKDRDTEVAEFSELYERVISQLDYQQTPTHMKPFPNIDDAFYTSYMGLLKKDPPAMLFLNNGDAYYVIGNDAIRISELFGLIIKKQHIGGQEQPILRISQSGLDHLVHSLTHKGFRVKIADVLESPKKKSKNQEPSNLKELEEELLKELERLKNGEDLGAPYLPASESCVVLNTVVPDSMEFETKQALELIKTEVGGSIDEFVRQRLGYASKLDLCKALSAEQTDAVAMAIYNIEAREQGMIIGDQTGIGKGRVAAAMIRYAVMQGHKPIFITEKPNLFTDIYRDLSAIGSSHLVPFIVNGRESKTDIKDENGEVIYQAFAPSEQQSYFKDKRIPGHCNFVVATYSQFNSPDKKPEKPQFLLEIAKSNVLILDESHNASGSSQVGEFLQKVLASSKGVVFLSATFAKRPDNMPIYAMKTAISDANMSKESLIYAITKGGVALQEILASQLVKEGQMLRRERSFEGVEVNYISLDERENEHKAIADNITDILRDIIKFQTGSIDNMIDELDDIAIAEGKEVDLREGTSQAGVDNQPYFSKVFNVINQMLFSIKADAVADRAIQRLQEGKKPVIAFASTMGSFIEQMENDKGLPASDGDTINADFSEVLMRGLDGVLRYTITTPEGKKEYAKFKVHELPPPVQAEYLRIAEKIKKMTSGISISPIDIIVQKLTKAGYKVAEVTGRKYEVQINTATNVGLVRSRNKINTNDAFRQFNNNEIDVLMINQSGSTGASAHAIVTPKVSASQVKQRVMIVLQAELDINTEVQKRGRINRTGQILSPIYDYMMSAIPAEKRLMMMLQKKLKSLDANTTSNQKQSTKILDVPDFLNKYGDKIVSQYLSDNKDVNKLLGDPLNLEDSEKETVLEEAAHKVSGRVAVLSTKMQAEFYNEISNSYNDYVEYLKQIGDYDLEVEAMNLQAQTLSQKVISMGKGGESEFGTDSILEKIEANVLKKPFSKTELQNILKEALNTGDAKHIQSELIKEYDLYLKALEEKESREIEAYYKELIQNIDKEKKGIKIRDKEGETAYLKYKAEREKELEGASVKELANLQTSLGHKRQYMNGIFKFFTVGKYVNYPVQSYQEGSVNVTAVFLGYLIDRKKKNPFAPSNVRLRFAIANSNKYIAIPASYTKDLNGIMGVSHSLAQPDEATLLENWEKAIKESTKDRSIRFVITGNILQAFAAFSGKLVSYTTHDGEIKKGILMPDYWEAKDFEDSISVPIERAYKIIASTVKGNGITTQNGVSLFNQGERYRIIVPGSTSKGGSVFLNEEILKLVNNHNFERTGDKMTAYLEPENLKPFIHQLQEATNDSLELTTAEFNLIKNERRTHKSRHPISLLSPEEVKEQEELYLLALSVEVELELELELLRLKQAA